MRVVDFCSNYFSPFASRDANGKEFNPKNAVVGLKIASYILFFIPAAIGVVYGIATLVNRVRKIENLQTESIEEKVASAGHSIIFSAAENNYDDVTAKFISQIEKVKKNEPQLIALMQKAFFALPANRFMQFFKQLDFTSAPLYNVGAQSDRKVFKPNGNPLQDDVERGEPKEGSLLRELYRLLEFNPDLLCYCGSKSTDETHNLDLYHLLLGPEGGHYDAISPLHRLTRKFHSGASSLYWYHRGDAQAHQDEVSTYLRQHPSKSVLDALPLDLYLPNTEGAKRIVQGFAANFQRGEPLEPLSEEKVIEKLMNDPAFLDVPDAFLNDAQLMESLLGKMNLGKFAYFLRRSTLYDDQGFVWRLMQKDPELISELGYREFDAEHQIMAIQLNRQQIHYWPNRAHEWLKERAERIAKDEPPTEIDGFLADFERNENRNALLFRGASRQRD